VPIYVEDICFLRLDKKGLAIPGIGGVTNLPDDWRNILMPKVEDPLRAELERMQEAAAVLKTALDEAKSALDFVNDKISEANKIISEAENVINQVTELASTAPELIASFDKQILDANNTLLKVNQYVTKKVCETTNSTVGTIITGILGGPGAVVAARTTCKFVNEVNDEWVKLSNKISDLEAKKNDLINKITEAPRKKAVALIEKANAEALELPLKLQKITLDKGYSFARIAVDEAQKDIATLRAIVDKFVPNIGDLLPVIGQWKPEWIRVIVNNKDFAFFNFSGTNVVLKENHSDWVGLIGSPSPEQQFVNGLRVNKNNASKTSDEYISGVTTLLGKDRNISGWERGPVSSAIVIGKLVNKPSPGTDGYVSLDLEVESVQVNGQTFILDGRHGINNNRYIRVEHLRYQQDGSEDTRYNTWKVGNRFRVTGPVKRDMDRITFYEIHTPNSASLEKL
jgi:hypothetical protein